MGGFLEKERDMLKFSVKAMIFALILSLAGCATTGNYGTSRGTIEVDRIFRYGAIPTEYRYYYNGWLHEPVAILGVHKDYTLRAKYWHEIELDEQQLKRLRRFFFESTTWYDDRAHGRMDFNGYRLFDPEGREVGIIYSRYKWIIVEFPEQNVVTVHAPQPHGISQGFRPL
jgi:hypothetical protein